MLELVTGEDETESRDESVGGDGRHTAARDERREGDGRGKDRAEEDGGDLRVSVKGSAKERKNGKKEETLTKPMKRMAFLGCPFLSTLPIHALPGRIPSRAMAKMRREAAVTAREVFC